VSRQRTVPAHFVVLAGLMTLSLSACSLVHLPALSKSPGEVTASESSGSSEPSQSAGLLPVPSHVYTDWTSPDRPQINPADYPATPPGMTDAPPGSGYERYFDQTVTWGPCATAGSAKVQCAHVLAPLDWTAPDGPAITLAMKRLAASKPLVDAASPDLFINPGGPGASAEDYLDSFRTAGLEGFDIVALDPRGSGESTPVVCGSTAQLDAYFSLNSAPSTDAEKTTLIDGAKAFALQCRQNSGALLDHISTIEAVYDFDMVRQLLGDAKFNWLGTSYGTFIGAVYLELYPENAGRMVLDAAVNITENDSVSQMDGFELALHKYAQWAASQGEASSETALLTQIDNFAKQLAGHPIQVGSRWLTQSLFITGLALYMDLGTSVYPQLTNVLQVTMGGNGTYMLQAADALNGRTANGYDTMATAFPAIGCKDGADKGLDDSFQQWQKDSANAPIFGTYMGPDVICDVWTAAPAPQIDFTGAGDPPFLVLGGTGDNATPYQYAQWMVQQMPAGVLVTRNGVGHGSYGTGSTCMDDIVVAFLVDGTIPPANTTCQMG
jgi:pimeloyl-ACP methyl ester carboxylesterase